jgi:hypothetical protein
MSEPVVLQLEHVGAKILTKAVASAIVLFNPGSHLKTPI